MEKNDSMNRFLSGEVGAASTKFIHNVMKVLQIESKKHTIDQFVSALKECLNDDRICFLQITLIHHKVLLGKEFYYLQGFDSSFFLFIRPLFYQERFLFQKRSAIYGKSFSLAEDTDLVY